METSRADVAPVLAGIGEAELGAFVREHYPRLIRLAGLICREPSDAADAVQVALEQAWRRRKGQEGQDTDLFPFHHFDLPPTTVVVNPDIDTVTPVPIRAAVDSNPGTHTGISRTTFQHQEQTHDASDHQEVFCDLFHLISSTAILARLPVQR